MAVLEELQQAATVVVDKVAPAVVRIGAGGGRGAGVVVADGLVLTNAHNIHGDEDVRIGELAGPWESWGHG